VASRAPGPNWPAGVPFVAADMPTATPFMLHVYAAMAEAEGIAISTRTKTALAAAKARGAKLGNPRLLAGSPGQARMVVTRDFSAHAIVYIIETTYISTGGGDLACSLTLSVRSQMCWIRSAVGEKPTSEVTALPQPAFPITRASCMGGGADGLPFTCPHTSPRAGAA
jgi:hypothetical protein